jgi:ankyrin repeat protein/WD40 repeat protein
MKKIFLILLISSLSVNAGFFTKDIHTAAKEGNLELLQNELNNKVDINTINNNGSSALFFAISDNKNNRFDTVKFLVENGANVNHSEYTKKITPLMLAVNVRDLKVVKYLIENGADVNQKDTDGGNALMIAAILGDLNIVKYLVEHKADLNAANNIGQDALILAAFFGKTEVVKYLLDQGMDINRQSNFGNTPLIISAIKSHKDTASLLIQKGANTAIAKNDGKTVLDYGDHSMRTEINTAINAIKSYKELDKNNLMQIRKFINEWKMDYGDSYELEVVKKAKNRLSKLLKNRKKEREVAQSNYKKLDKQNFSTLKTFSEKANKNLPQFKKAGNDIAKLIFKQDKLDDYRWFADTYPSHKDTQKVLNKISSLSKTKNQESCKEVAKKIASLPSRNQKIIEKFNGKALASTFSPDCKTIAIGYADNTIKLRDNTSYKLITTLKDSSELVKQLIFSPNGKYIVAKDQNKNIGLWNTETGNKVTILKKHANDIDLMFFTADGKNIIYLIDSGFIKKQSFSDYSVIDFDRLSYRNINSIAANNNGSRIIAGFGDRFIRPPSQSKKDNSIKILNSKTGELIKTIKNDSMVQSVEFTDDGANILFTDEYSINLIDKDNKVHTISNQYKARKSFSAIDSGYISETPDKNSIITLNGHEGKIELWSAKTGKLLSKLANSAKSVSLSNDGNSIIYIDQNNIANLLDIEFYNEIQAKNIYQTLSTKNLVEQYIFVNRFLPNYDVVIQAKDNIAKIIQKRNTTKDYAWFVRNYPNHKEVNAFVNLAYKLIKQENKISRYEWFIAAFPNHSSKNAIRGIFAIVKQKNTLDDYIWFEEKYRSNKHTKQATKGILDLLAIKNKVSDYDWFEDKYSSYSEYANQAVNSAYKIINKENKINRYRWFIERFSYYDTKQKAVRDMHSLAYQQAKKKDTLEAYNHFSISYPFAEQIQLVSDKAYKLEEKKYSGWFASDEKNSTALYIKIRQMEKRGEKSNNNKYDSHYGYNLVMERMGQLLQDLFPSEVATMNYMETSRTKDVKIKN